MDDSSSLPILEIPRPHLPTFSFSLISFYSSCTVNSCIFKRFLYLLHHHFTLQIASTSTMSSRNTRSAHGTLSARDTTQQPSNTFYESQAASGLTTEAPMTTNDPSTTAAMAHHGMLRADIAATTTTTTTTTTVSSDAPVCAGPSNSSPIQQQQDLAQLADLMGALSLRTPDQPATPSSGHESGYEADGERKLERPKASRKQPSRRALRKRQRRRLLGETVVRRSRSGSPSLRARTTQEARPRWSRPMRRSF
jgi:hypothetical protein